MLRSDLAAIFAPKPIPMNHEVFISYKWGGESEKVVNQLDEAFQKRGLTIVRDKRDLGYKGLIREFMQRIGKGNFVVVVISDGYLRSENCMYELLEIAKHPEFYDRIFPITLADAKIYRLEERVSYVAYWEQRFKALNESMQGLSSQADLQGFREGLDQFARIRQHISTLTDFLANLNTLTPDMHHESDFGEIYTAIDRKLKAQQGLSQAQGVEFVPNQDYVYDVFLSYSSRDLEAAERIAAELRLYNLRVFIAAETLREHPGVPFPQIIAEALEKSQHLILLCTPAAMESVWVKLEYQTFFSHVHLADQANRRFFVLRGKGYRTDLMPNIYRSVQTEDNPGYIVAALTKKVLETPMPTQKAIKIPEAKPKPTPKPKSSPKPTPKPKPDSVQARPEEKPPFDYQKLRKPAIAIVGLAMALILLVWLWPNEQSRWQKAQVQNTLQSYRGYINAYPNGQYTTLAKERLNEIEQKDWLIAKQTNNIAAYRRYTTTHPQGIYTDSVNNILQNLLADSVEWQTAQTQNTRQSYDAYISRYPSGVYADEAKTKLLEFLPEPITKLLNDMVFVEGGSFTMGCKSGRDSDCESDEKAHSVTLSDFSIGKYEVTQALWRAVMGTSTSLSNPSYFKNCDECPVENVSWDDIQKFLRKLSEITGKKFLLPTEAQWEYAARGGQQSKGYQYAGSNNLNSVAWYGDNSNSKTHPVGQKQPNELGLYDMSGNVWEWCSDWYGDYPSSSTRDPQGPSSGSGRVLRGGSWISFTLICRAAFRDNGFPSYRNYDDGLRVAVLAPPQ